MSKYRPRPDRIPLSSPLFSKSEAKSIHQKALALLERLKNWDAASCDYDQSSALALIHGVASTGTVINGKAMDPAGCELVVPIPLLFEHAKHAEIGKVVRMQKDESRIYVQGVIFNTDEGRDVWDDRPHEWPCHCPCGNPQSS
jgi:hypothetical protein